MTPALLAKLHIAITSLLAVLAPTSPQDSAHEPEKSPLVSASCMARISCDPRVVLIDTGSLREILATTAVRERVTAGLIRAPLEPTDDRINIEFNALSAQPFDNGNSAFGRLVVSTDRSLLRDPAATSAAAMLPRLRDALRDVLDEATDAALGEANRAHAAAVYDAAAKRDAAAATRQELAKRLESFNALPETHRSADHVLTMLRLMEDQSRDLESELAGLNATREALELRVADAAKRAAEQAAGDEAARELQVIAALREQKLRSIEQLVKAGSAPSGDLADAQEAVAQARVELAARRKDAAGGDDMLRELSNRLIELSIKSAELTARRAHVADQLGALRDANVLQQARAFEELSSALPVCENDLRDAEANLETLKQSRPKVVAPAVELLLGDAHKGKSTLPPP